MAKTIKCPTCSTAIEITPSALGQIVKCPGCGRGIKLVAKQKSAPAAGAGGGGARAPVAGPSAAVSGLSESQRSYVGEPALTDEPPRLDTTCENCGKYTDEADLVEDQGRMVCKECALSAAAERSEEPGPELAPPPYVPSRRGNLINFTPITFVFIFFALVWTVMYFLPRLGVGQRPDLTAGTNKPIKRGGITPAATQSAPITEQATNGQEATTQPEVDQAAADAQAAAEEKAKADAEWEKANRDEVMLRFANANRAFAEQNKEEADRLYREAFDFIKDRELKDPTLSNTVVAAGKLWRSLHAAPAVPQTPTVSTQPVATTPDPGAPTPPQPTPPTTPQTPLAQALHALKQKDYVAAGKIFEDLRKQMASHGQLPPTLTPEQQTIFLGKAAADLGARKYPEARAAVDILYLRGNRSKPVVLNRAMIFLAGNQGTLKELGEMIESVQGVMNDELSADIYGTLLNKVSKMQLNDANRAAVAKRQKELDEFNEQRFAATHPGQLKWGIDWLPAESVKQYRLLKGSVQDTALTQLRRQLELATRRQQEAEKKYNDALSRGVTNTTALKTALDAANEQLQSAKQKVSDAEQAVQPQRWLEQFEPIVPEDQL